MVPGLLYSTSGHFSGWNVKHLPQLVCSALPHCFLASHVSMESLKLLLVCSNLFPLTRPPPQSFWCVLFIPVLKFQNESFFLLQTHPVLYLISLFNLNFYILYQLWGMFFYYFKFFSLSVFLELLLDRY